MTFKAAALLPSLLSASLTLVLFPASTDACPYNGSCITTAASVADAPPFPRRQVDVRPAVAADLVPVTESRPLQLAVRIDPADPSAIEMPWIWQLLKREVYQRLPRYEEPKRFSLVLSPVIVASLNEDSVPGVGVSGDF